MIGERYWSTGIIVAKVGDQWSVKLNFHDGGFCDPPSTEGQLRCRYLVDDLSAGIDTLKADADRLGIEWSPGTVYYEGDGEWPDRVPPEGWEDIVDAQAARLGWAQTYKARSEIASR
jgi:hypothetical protein